MGRIAIVLGAGGITGTAWVLGALEGIQRETGWDPRTADVVCGTSAGALAAAVLAGGVATESLLEMAERPGEPPGVAARRAAIALSAGFGAGPLAAAIVAQDGIVIETFFGDHAPPHLDYGLFQPASGPPLHRRDVVSA
jgi:hypothetical protein